MKKRKIDNEMKNLLQKLLKKEEYNLLIDIIENLGKLDFQENN